MLTLTLAIAAAAAPGSLFTFSVPIELVVGLLISSVLPLLVGLVTTRVTSSGWKASLLAALAAVNGGLTELAAAIASGGTYDVGVGLVVAFGGFIVGVGMHFGLYKPTGAAAALQAVGTKK